MKTTLTTGAALLLTTTAAFAGGIDRGGNAYSVLFEDSNYLELSFSTAKPDVSGDYPAALGGGSTGNMAEAYNGLGLALKYGITDQIDVGLFLNQPYGANAAYMEGAYTGLSADWDSNQIAVVLKYQVNPNVSVFGGARSVESQANIAIPDAILRGGTAGALQAGLDDAIAAGDTATASAIGAQLAAVGGAPAGTFNYTAETNSDRQTSYIAGVAYERPDIAMRVALTYESGFTHSFETTESYAFGGLAGFQDTMEIEMPQSVTLDFQSGVAADTLVFGSIRWSEWSVWEVRPTGYEASTGGDRVTGIDDDVMTYRLGVGRRINDNLSVFGRVTYEGSNGGEASRLAPTDGNTSIGFGGSYTMDDMKITAGVEYAMLGDATDGSGVAFNDNSAIGVGVSIGYSF